MTTVFDKFNKTFIRLKDEIFAVLLGTNASEGASLIGVRDVAAVYAATNVEAALAEVKALVDAGMPVLKKTVTVLEGDLVSAVNGASAAINVGTALPANARIVGVDMRAETAFSGGGATALKCDVGTAGDVDALVVQADLFAAVVDGGPPAVPAGARPNKTYAAGGQLIATFTPDAGHTLTGLTAGAVTIDVLYTVLA